MKDKNKKELSYHEAKRELQLQYNQAKYTERNNEKAFSIAKEMRLLERLNMKV